MLLFVFHSQSEVTLKRVKRRWGPPPFNIMENENGPFPRYLETVKNKQKSIQSMMANFQDFFPSSLAAAPPPQPTP